MSGKSLTLKAVSEEAHRSGSAEEIIKKLRAQGFRITKIRQSMIEALASLQQPISAPELLEVIAQRHSSVNKTTIYRELDFLADEKVLLEIDLLDGVKRYELLHLDHHHHHLVCTSCRTVRCVEVPHNDLHALEEKIRESHEFTVRSHVLEFFGLCHKCN